MSECSWAGGSGRVPSFPLLSCESPVPVKENPDRKKQKQKNYESKKTNYLLRMRCNRDFSEFSRIWRTSFLRADVLLRHGICRCEAIVVYKSTQTLHFKPDFPDFLLMCSGNVHLLSVYLDNFWFGKINK